MGWHLLDLCLHSITLLALGLVIHLECALHRKVDCLISKQEDLKADLDAIKTDADALVTLVANQNAQIAALSAQVAAGTPVTQAQLDALTSEAQGVLDELSPLVTPPTPPTPPTP
jgi:hypothetical protein